MKEKIKIGVLVKDLYIQLWEYRILEKLHNTEFAELVLVIKLDIDYVSNKNNSFSAFYRLHEKLDKYIYGNRFDYNKKVDISTLCGDIPVITYSSSFEKSANTKFEETHEKILDYGIDIILNFGYPHLKYDLLKIPRSGIWSFNVGNRRATTGFPSVYWEIVKKVPEIGCSVSIILSDSDNETTIYKTSLSTFSNSIHINRNRIFGLATLIIPRQIKKIYFLGDSHLINLRNKFNNNVEVFDNKIYQPPSSFKAFYNLVLILANSFRQKIIFLKNENWFLLYSINEAKNSFPLTLGNFNKLKAPKGKYWADPFVISEGNRYFVFIEEYINKTEKGHISRLELDNKGILRSSKIIIERPYHMSYPFIFCLNGIYYMIPETKSVKTIQLYRCQSFPDQWEFVMNIMENVAAADTTLYFNDKKWWLFTSIDELNNSEINYSELFLFYSDDLFSGLWQHHPGNPIVTEINSSRSAGKIFEHNGKIYRPSQDCTGGYGRAVNLNQITRLSVSEYEEILTTRLEPKWNQDLAGMHTFNLDKNFVVMDACSLRKRFTFINND